MQYPVYMSSLIKTSEFLLLICGMDKWGEVEARPGRYGWGEVSGRGDKREEIIGEKEERMKE